MYPSKGDDKKCLFPCNEEALISEILMHVCAGMNTNSQTFVGISTSVSNNEKKKMKNLSEYILIFYITQPIDTAR